MSRKKSSLIFGALLVLLTISTFIPLSSLQGTTVLAVNGDSWVQQVDTSRMLADIEVLASDQYKGRFIGTLGDEMTQDYINNQLAELNVSAMTSRDDFKQPFDVSPWVIATNPINLIIDGQTLVYGEDYIELTFSGNSSITSEIFFAGYGISTYDYDDYSDIDVTGKIVVVSRGTPEGVSYEYGYYSAKAKTAHEFGASGLIAFRHPNTGSDTFRKGTVTPYNFAPDMGTLSANRTSLERIGLNVSEWINDLDTSLSSGISYQGSKSRGTGINATMEVTVQYKQKAESANVIAKFQGINSGESDRAIILSAHHDHQGENLEGEVYPGADDDASGVAVVLEVARVLDYLYDRYNFQKSVILALWGAEEIGLYGSYHYVNNPLFPLERTDLVIQHDMVGLGPVDGTLYVEGGSYIPSTMMEDIHQAATVHGKIQNVLATGGGGSDHIAFLDNGVPGVMFFWDEISEHPYYHTPGDTVDLIDPEVLEKVTMTTLGYLIDSSILVEDQSVATEFVEIGDLFVTACAFVALAAWIIKERRIGSK
ncbi:MAG: M28 family peptidase [Candidatus Hodarchaeales archaeon]